MVNGSLVAFENLPHDRGFDAVEWCIVSGAGFYVSGLARGVIESSCCCWKMADRGKTRSTGTSGKTWQNGNSGKRKGTNIPRGPSGAAMMFAAKPKRKRMTREEGMIVCLGWGKFTVRYCGLRNAFARI